MFFLNPIFEYFTIYKNFKWQHLRFICQKPRNGWKNIFHECYIKIIKYVAEKSLSVFKDAIFGIFEHTKNFIGKMFYYFYVTFMKIPFQLFLILL